MNRSYQPPAGWTLPALAEIAAPIKGAIRIGPFGSALKKSEYSEAGVRVLGIEDVFPNRLVSERLKYIPEGKFTALSQYAVSPGDLLVTNMGTVGRTCVVPDGLEKSIISSHLIKVSLDHQAAFPQYISWMLNYCPLVVSQIKAKCHGAIMAGFNSSLLKELRIPLPPVLEQRRIAAILDHADALRAKRREALAQLDSLTQAIFVEMFGDPVSNDRAWPWAAVSDFVAGFESGKSIVADDEDESDSPYRVLKISAVTSLEYKPEHSKAMPSNYTPPASHIVRKGDLLFSRANTTELIGATAYVNETPDNLLLPDKLWRFVWFEKPRAAPLYVRQLFQQAKFRREIGDRASGSSGSMKNISQPKVLSIQVGNPPLVLQHTFSTRVQVIESVKSRHRTALSELDALFASLQHRAFRGEL